MSYYELLLDMLKHGHIQKLELQPKFVFKINGVLLKSSRGRDLTYRADFKWYESFGVGDSKYLKAVVADVKGVETDLWKLKWAMVKALYPAIEFRAIKRSGTKWIQL